MTYGGIEAGGTKVVCALGTGPDDLRALTCIPTTTPEETLENVVAFFQHQDEEPSAVGVGSFGPLDADPRSPTYGQVTTTPKHGWQHTDVAGIIRCALDVPVAFDTDVNAAALGEHRWGAARDVDTVLYLTVGTGVGGGALVEERPLHGLLHPEMGHIRVPRAPGDAFEGCCPFHGDCLEGLASGSALRARFGVPPESLPSDHAVWELEAHYLASALVHFVYTLSPERILLGGGVMRRRRLFPMIRHRVREALSGYLDLPAFTEQIDAYIVPPALGERAGVLGALVLAHNMNSAT